MAILPIILILLAILIAGIVAYLRLYVKAPPNMAFIRTGFRGKRVVLDGGTIVLPVIQTIRWISLETMKLEVIKANREGMITKDKFRVDMGAEFYIKVDPSTDQVENALRSLGEKSMSSESIRTLIEEKLVSALRSEAAKHTLMDLHENRIAFAKKVAESLAEPLSQNGLTLENVAIFALDQTDLVHLNPDNVFDAEGLKQIVAQTSERQREKNEIQRNNEVAIRKKDVEAEKAKFTLDREREFAATEQDREIDNDRVLKRAEAERFRFDHERAIREAEIEKEQSIREAELRKEAYLAQKAQEREIVEVEKEKKITSAVIEKERELEALNIQKTQRIEQAKRESDIAILQKEKDRIVEERAKLVAEVERIRQAQAVATEDKKAEAERERELAVIHAMQEYDVAEQKSRAIERLALSKAKDGEAEALAREKKVAADNCVDSRLLIKEVALKLIEHAPEIAEKLMEPASRIESIKILDVNSPFAAHGVQNGNGGVVGKVLSSVINTGAVVPLLHELASFTGLDIARLAQELTNKNLKTKGDGACSGNDSDSPVPAETQVES